MGILGLSKLIADLAPLAIRESEIKNFFGKLGSPASGIESKLNNPLQVVKLPLMLACVCTNF